MKPMLASPADLDNIRYPVFASPKLDGIRCSIVEGRALSRTLKRIPNGRVDNVLSWPSLSGLDGELIVGDPTSPTCYRDTVSGVMSGEGEPEFTYYVFDLWNSPMRFQTRTHDLRGRVEMGLVPDCVTLVKHEMISSRQQLDAYETEQVSLGYEGVMLNDPNATYKFGRATTKGGELLKVKRYTDSEAVVTGVVEEMHNGNEAQTNELGRTKRSSAKAGKTGKGTMGALMVLDVKTGVEFEIGTGFTAADRVEWWQWWAGVKNRGNPPRRYVKYKFFPVGVKDKPRHPVYLGVRPPGA